MNVQTSSWTPILAGIPEGSISRQLFFLIYINDLGSNLSSTVKLFADDTSVFSIVHDVDLSSKQLNDDLKKVSDWVYQWKMSFNPDLSKQAQEVIFSRKASRVDHPVVTFNNSPLAHTPCQKHLGLYLDERLNFSHHIKEKISKACKGIGVIRKLHYILPRHSLLTIYKSFIRPHLDYGDIIYDQPNNQAFSNKLEAVQYNAALAITGAIRGTSRIKIYQELGLESLKSCIWFRHLCYFYKIKNYGFPGYLFKLIPLDTHSYNTRFSENITTYCCRTDIFKHSFFPWTIVEWNKLDFQCRKATYVFRKHLLKSIRPLSKPIYDINNPPGVRLLTRLRLGLSHLNEHRFNHNFEGCINPLCTCTLEVESTNHFFLHCHYYNNIRKTLLDDLRVINVNILKLSENALTDLLLYGDASFDKIRNKMILTASIKFIVDSDRFTGSIF